MRDRVPPLTDDHQPPPGARQEQFLNVISRDEAERRFQRALTFPPPDCETIPLSSAAGRVLWGDVVATGDVPSFDRSNVDGFAIGSADTRRAAENAPRFAELNSEMLSPGVRPTKDVLAGWATTIATGGMLPRGADAVLMVEHSELTDDGRLEIHRALAPGENVTFAGTDISCGETVLRAGQRLTSRELGTIAAVGLAEVGVVRQPRVAILSTGNEIVPPGRPLPVGSVYDSNAAILSAAVTECGGVPVPLGIVPDDEPLLEAALQAALRHDVVLLSGGTSKGAGDLSYRIVSRLGSPGIVAHGVALKPGKPICLAVCNGKPIVILPGFPTSAIFTFHEFAAPLIRRLAGRPAGSRRTLPAVVPHRVNSQRGRTEYLLVNLFERDAVAAGPAASRNTPDPSAETGGDDKHSASLDTGFPRLVAYPLGQGSGSVTTFSRADGFITIEQQAEIVDAGTRVVVTLLDEQLHLADLTVITSHCIGLDRLLSHVQREGFTVKMMTIGSSGALAAAQRGECDVAGIHLLDPESGEYNRPFLTNALHLVPGYGRMQCFVCRPDDDRFAGSDAFTTVSAAASAPDCRMVNRNAGSGTRILLDRLLAETGREASAVTGYGVQVRSHNAVCAAIQQGRADWGVAIDVVASLYGLRALPLSAEQFDFVIPRDRMHRPAVQAFLEIVRRPSMHDELQAMGFAPRTQE